MQNAVAHNHDPDQIRTREDSIKIAAPVRIAFFAAIKTLRHFVATEHSSAKKHT